MPVALGVGVPFKSKFGGGAGVDPGLTLLQSATLWLDASDMATNAQWLRNKGTGGRALDARVGSVGSAQIINGALKLPGLASNNASLPDSAAVRPTGDLELVARIAPGDWTPAVNMRIINGGSNTISTQNYCFSIHTDGKLLLERYIAGGGAGLRFAYSTVATGFTDGDAKWVKVTFDSDNGAGGSDFVFYTASDQETEPSTWTQLGTTVTVAGTTGAGNSATNGVWIGTSGSDASNRYTGTIFRVIGRSAIGGSTFLDADFTAQSTLATSFTESSSNAATVTINSTSGVDTNDPLLLTHTGTNYLYLPGITGNYAKIADAAALRPTGDLEIVMRVAPADWTPSSRQYLYHNGGSGVSTMSFSFSIHTDGKLLFERYQGASAARFAYSTVPTSFTDGSAMWIKATFDQDNGSGGSDFNFYYAADQATEPSSWTQLGTTVTIVGETGAGNSGTTGTWIGAANGGGSALNGNIFRAIARGSIGGSAFVDAVFSANTSQTSFTESSSNAATVDIFRTTSGRKSVMVVRPTLLFGTDDYLEVADNALLDIGASDDFTVLTVNRTWGTISTTRGLMAKRGGSAAGNTGWSMRLISTTDFAFGVADGTVGTNDFSATTTLGSRVALAGVRNVGADTLDAFVDSSSNGTTTDGTSATLANAEVFRVGRMSGAATDYYDGEVDQVAVFRSALTSAELGQIATYLGV